MARRYADNAGVLLQLALCYLGDPSSEGVSVAERAIAADPNMPLAHVALAMLAHQTGELTRALEEYENALLIWSNEPGWHDAAGDLCIQIGSIQAGIIHRKQAWALDNHQAAYAFKLGQACLSDEADP